jgi:hypothetical protein
VRPTLSQPEAADGRGRLAVFASNVLWHVVGLATGAIAYAAEAGGFELEMRRVRRKQGVRTKKKVRGLSTL